MRGNLCGRFAWPKLHHRFVDPADENEFYEDYSHGLPKQVCILSVASLVIVPFLALGNPSSGLHEFQVVSASITCILWAVVLLILRLRRSSSNVSKLAEFLSCAALAFSMLVSALWNVLHIHGHIVECPGTHHHGQVPSEGLFVLTILVVNILLSIHWLSLMLVNIFTALCFTLATAQLGAAEDHACGETSRVLVFLGLIVATYLSWQNETHFRAKWKHLKLLEAHKQAMRDLMRTSFDIYFEATDQLHICTEHLQLQEFFGNVTGKKLQDLVIPDCSKRLASILAPLHTTVRTARVVMTPPLSLQSNSQASSACGRTLTQAVMVVADAGGVRMIGETSGRYFIGLQDLQYEDTQETVEPATPEMKWPAVNVDSFQGPRSDCMRSDVSTPQTARVFRRIRQVSSVTNSETSNPSSLQKDWEELVDLGRREHWLIPAKDIAKIEPDMMLGKGGFGSVHAGLLHGSPIASKEPAQWHRATFALANELCVLRRIRHPNIVILHGACIDPSQKRISLVFEKIEGETLHSYLDSKRVNKHVDSRYCVLENISCALRYLHEQKPKIVHSDLKDTNVMVEMWEGRPRARLLDFGLSCLATRSSSLVGGSWRWAAPELFSCTKKARPSSDVFSFGRILHRVLTSQTPLTGVREKSTVELFFTRGILWTPCWYGQSLLSQQAHILSNKCLQMDEALRPSAKDVHERIKLMQKYSSLCQDQLIDIVPSQHDQLRFSITFDALDTGMPIVDCSLSLQALMSNVCIEGDLLDIVTEPEKLFCWVQLHVQLLADSKTSKDVMQTEFSFQFCTGTGNCVQLCAICFPDAWEEPEMKICMRDVRVTGTGNTRAMGSSLPL